LKINYPPIFEVFFKILGAKLYLFVLLYFIISQLFAIFYTCSMVLVKFIFRKVPVFVNILKFMSSFFFKKFEIKQQPNVLKVTTEAITLGAYVAQTIMPKANPILDIGTGSGLLALMLAQQKLACIHAVEMDPTACQLAAENFEKSSFANQIQLFQSAIQDFKPKLHYQVIISNPPFYKNHLSSQKPSHNHILHTNTLSFAQLAIAVARLLSVDGQFYVLLPSIQMQELEAELLKNKLFLQHSLALSHRKSAKVLRKIATYGWQNQKTSFSELCIKDENEQYSAAFKDLTKDYYLAL
jgi:tRNA1Val (adenine37-N6)-methyltransferase